MFNHVFQQLKLSAMKILGSIIKSCDVSISHSFIHGCIPSIVAEVERPVIVHSELELNFYKELFTLLETLVAMTADNLRE